LKDVYKDNYEQKINFVESQITDDMQYFCPGAYENTGGTGENLAQLRTILRNNEIILEEKKLKRQ